MSGIYVVRLDEVSISAAKTLVEVTAPSSAVLEIQRMYVRSKAATSEGSSLKVQRKSAAGTGTSFTPIALGNWPAAGMTARTNDTAEGTPSTVIDDTTFNLVPGWEWVALNEFSRITVPPSGIIGITLNTAPAAATVFSALMEIIEKG